MKRIKYDRAVANDPVYLNNVSYNDRASIKQYLKGKENCCKNAQGVFCCLAKHFCVELDEKWDDAVSYVLRLRQQNLRKNKSELKIFLMDKVKQCTTVYFEDGIKKHAFNYELPPIQHGENVLVCRKIYAWIYNFGMTKFKEALKVYVDLADVNNTNNATYEPCPQWKDSHVHEFSWNETVEMAGENSIDISNSQVRAGLAPINGQETIVWLEKYFEANMQHNPNKCEGEVKVHEKQDVYEEYKADFLGKQEVLGKYISMKLNSKQIFFELWDLLFPYSVFRTWCDIPGHCKTCAEIQDIRNSSSEFVVREACKKAHHLHRSCLFMPERLLYKARCCEAIFQEQAPNETVLSIIIDTMDTFKNSVPKEGAFAFTTPIYQHLVGCKVHGHGVNFYSTYGSIQGKSPDLIIYIISKEIEKFKKRNKGRNPEKLYIQVDGGGENANQYVLGFIELLAIKRMAKIIILTRLPVGHTHEV